MSGGMAPPSGLSGLGGLGGALGGLGRQQSQAAYQNMFAQLLAAQRPFPFCNCSDEPEPEPELAKSKAWGILVVVW